MFERMRTASVQRTADGQPTPVEDVGVDHGRLDVPVAEELLDGADVVVGFQDAPHPHPLSLRVGIFALQGVGQVDGAIAFYGSMQICGVQKAPERSTFYTIPLSESIRGIDVSHRMCYHRTNVDTQLSKFVVILASVARQIHRRPLPPIPRINPVSGERVAPRVAADR